MINAFVVFLLTVVKIFNGYSTTPSAVQTAYYETSQICPYNEWDRLWNEAINEGK
jgi:hypothetical protein